MSRTTPPVSEQPPPAPGSPLVVAHPAGLGRRLGALLYDSLLILAMWMITLLPLVALLVPPEGEPLTGWWLQPLLVAEVAAFYLGCWHRGGQTLGMAAWRIKLLSHDSSPCRWQQLWRRLLCAPLSLLCFGLGFFWLLLDPERATWHDRFSATVVVHLPKP